ncbi:EF-hand domain-containing protein [Leisingera sp. XS_AS12]|jgi:hypothetical protein|uniref:hypothetical protein n=1 Tax=unclassified Leisingera TaxID=2614906 RepID=UPI001C95B6F5|nr:hypothetical protein [Nocardioides marinus]
MKSFALTAAAVTALAASPLAALDLDGATDMDGDGSYSLDELQVVYPELSAETFATIDADADGEATEDEVQAAVDAGLLTKEG